MSPKSRTHHIAVLVQDNGELAEDVVERELVEQAHRRRHRLDGEPDDRGPDLGTDGADSFPASEPPSSWSGVDSPVEKRSEPSGCSPARPWGRASPPGRADSPDDPER